MSMLSSEWAGDDCPCDEPYIDVNHKEVIRIQKIKSKFGNAMGDCYIKNYHNFKKLSKSNPYLKYVVVMLKYRQSGNTISHALCYDGDTVIEASQGYSMRLDRSIFEGKITHKLLPAYDILSYKIYDKSNIPSLETILDLFLTSEGDGYKLMTKGKLPRLKGRWEHAKDSVI